MHAWRASDVNGVALRALASLTDLLTHEISILDDAAVGLELRVGSAGRDAVDAAPRPVRRANVLDLPGVLGLRGRARDVDPPSRRRRAGRPRSVDGRSERRPRLHAGSGDRTCAGDGAADRAADDRGFQRRRHGRRRGTDRGLRRAPVVDRRDHRAASAAAARAGRARPELHRPRADAAALPADGHRPGVRRGDREPLLRRRRRGRVGRAVVFGERLEVGRRPAGVSAAAAGEGPVAAAPAAVRRGLSLSSGGDRDRRRARLLRRAIRADACATKRCIAAPSGSTRRRSRACACRRRRAGSRRRSCRTTKRSTTAAPSSATVPCSSSAACRRGRSCSSPAAICCSRRTWRSASSASTTRNSSVSAPPPAKAIA